MDRDVLLLRPPRPVAPGAEGPRGRGGGRRGRALGGARRRLLQGAEVRRRAAAAAGPPRLVQVGGVRDLALRLRPDRRPLLPRGLERARPAGRRPRSRGWPSRSRSPSSSLAWLVYDVLCRVVSDARVLWTALFVLVALAAWASTELFSAAGGVAPGRRDDRHRHGRERPLRDHPGPTRADPREAGGPRPRPGPRAPGEAALGAQQLPDAAGAPDDAGRALRVRLGGRERRVAHPRRADGAGRVRRGSSTTSATGPHALGHARSPAPSPFVALAVAARRRTRRPGWRRRRRAARRGAAGVRLRGLRRVPHARGRRRLRARSGPSLDAAQPSAERSSRRRSERPGSDAVVRDHLSDDEEIAAVAAYVSAAAG